MGPRIVAPLALAGVLIALFAVISSSGGGEDGAGAGPATSKRASDKKPGSGATNPRKYTVQEGDTLTAIAAQFDVSTKRLMRLNPGIDPQVLAPGADLKIR